MADALPTTRALASRAVDDFRELLEPGAIRAVFQPIVRLGDLQPIGYEGLARFPTPPGLVALPPDVTLAAAGRLGVRDDLEVACWAAISEAGPPPAGRLLFVNVAPDALGHPGLMELAAQLPTRLVIELTEQDAVQNVTQLRERLRPWIARGALIAVDDAGAGFTSLEYVAEIRPDFLKLCRGMVTGVDLDPSRQAVLRATVAFAREVGARIVAEGVERPEELAVLREAEVDYGQGWLFGRPGAGVARGARTARGRAGAPPHRPPRARARRRHERPRGLRGRRRAPRPPRPDAERVPGGRRPPALPGRRAATGRSSTACPPPPASSGAPTAPARRPWSTTSPSPRTTWRPSPRCTPRCACRVRIGERVAGVLNAESPTAPGPALVAEVERCAAMLGTRLEDLGGVPPVSPAQQLARTAVRLASLEDAEDIVRETVTAARALAGFESAMLALPDGDGGLYVHHAEGSFAVALAQLERHELDADRRLGRATAPPATRPPTPAAAASPATRCCARPAPTP